MLKNTHKKCEEMKNECEHHIENRMNDLEVAVRTKRSEIELLDVEMRKQLEEDRKKREAAEAY